MILGLGLALPFTAAKVSYDGYKAFRIESGDKHESVHNLLKDIDHVSLECQNSHKGFEIAVSPRSLDAFKALDLDHKVVHEDFGAELAAEASHKPYVGR